MFSSFRRFSRRAWRCGPTVSLSRYDGGAQQLSRSVGMASPLQHPRADYTTAAAPHSARPSLTHRSRVPSQAGASEREEAWLRFTKASRQLRKAVREQLAGRDGAVPGNGDHGGSAKSGSSSASLDHGNSRHNIPRVGFSTKAAADDEEGDAALAALAPPIVSTTATAAANAALMAQLGVVDHAQLRASDTSLPLSSDERVGHPLRIVSPHCVPEVLRVCQTGLQAQVSSLVILKHLWAPFSGGPTEAGKKENDKSEVPTEEWCCSLPSTVRLQLLASELARVQRRRRFIDAVLHGSAELNASVRSAESPSATPQPAAVSQAQTALEQTWEQCVTESRSVLRCCAAPWLTVRKDSDGDSAALGRALLLTPGERSVLLASLQLAAECHAEALGHVLMRVFMREVDTFVTAATDHWEKDEAALDAFYRWYETEGGSVYEAATACAAHQRTHTTTPQGDAGFSWTPTTAVVSLRDAFAVAYGYLVHRGRTMAQLDYLRGLQDTEDEQTGDAAATRSSPPSGSAWTSVLLQHPALTMQLLARLAQCVDANADHLDVVRQQFHRLLDETDVGYTFDATVQVRQAFCALLEALARVPLTASDKLRLLDDAYRRTTLTTAAEVLLCPTVLAACLRVCSAAAHPGRTVTVFNKLAEPASRSMALAEENLAALCLVEAAAPAVLQRVLSAVQLKLPITADHVHAGVARALLLSDGVDSTSTYALLDLLGSDDSVQSRTTRSTAAAARERTFFLRVLTMVAVLAEETEAKRLAGTLSALRTAAAAGIFERWLVDAALLPPPGRKDVAGSIATALSPVTVSLLQELCLRLRCDSALAGSAASNAAESAGSFPLLAAVEDVLRSVPDVFDAPASWAEARGVHVEGTAAFPAPMEESVHVSVPSSLLWRQLRNEWPLAEQQRLLDSFADLFAPSATAAGDTTQPATTTLCVGYGGYNALCTLYKDWRTAAARDVDEARVWAHGSTTRAASAAFDSLSDVVRLRASECSPRRLRVLSPLEEVVRALDPTDQREAPTRRTRGASTPLSELVPVSVPAVLGCPSHDWREVSSKAQEGRATPRKAVVAYWVRRWVDAVEDARALPQYSLFRTAAMQGVEAATLSGAKDGEEAPLLVDGASDDATSAAEGGGTSKVNPKRSGLGDLFVRGPG